MLAFERASAPELVDHYFDLPSVPLLVIRRLIYLDDPRVVPALRKAFDRQKTTEQREFVAAALDRLGEQDQRYFEYLSHAALDAAKSGIPLENRLSVEASTEGDLLGLERIRSWAKSQSTPEEQAVWSAAIDTPAAIEALTLTGDRRAFPILLIALRSPNFLVVRESALGLGRMHELSAINPIITACQRLDAEDRPWIAKSLLYFQSRKAQEAASSIIGDPARLQRWRIEISREEQARSSLFSLSKAVQRLDEAAVELDRVSLTIHDGGNPAVERALFMEYIREIDGVQNSLAGLPTGRLDEGLVLGVIDRLASQRSRLRQMDQSARSHDRVEKARRLLELISETMEHRSVHEAP